MLYLISIFDHMVYVQILLSGHIQEHNGQYVSMIIFPLVDMLHESKMDSVIQFVFNILLKIKYYNLLQFQLFYSFG